MKDTAYEPAGVNPSSLAGLAEQGNMVGALWSAQKT